MTIQLSDRFTYGKLIKFTLSSIAMMILTSIGVAEVMAFVFTAVFLIAK